MRMLGTALSKKEDRMREAASLMLKSGHFQEYCEIYMELGEYESAIAVAPKVSLKYWKNCIQTYLDYLNSDEAMKRDEGNFDPEAEKISYLLLLNRVDEAALALHERGETSDAKAVKALKINGGFFSDVLLNHESVAVSSSLQTIKHSLHDLDPQDK
jgi:hypothetical protein